MQATISSLKVLKSFDQPGDTRAQIHIVKANKDAISQEAASTPTSILEIGRHSTIYRRLGSLYINRSSKSSPVYQGRIGLPPQPRPKDRQHRHSFSVANSCHRTLSEVNLIPRERLGGRRRSLALAKRNGNNRPHLQPLQNTCEILSRSSTAYIHFGEKLSLQAMDSEY